jgi:hypothetical protein
MEYKIISYNAGEDYFKCEEIKTGKIENIDLFRNNSYKGFGNISGIKDLNAKYQSLIGKTVKIEETFPYLLFARNVKLIY